MSQQSANSLARFLNKCLLVYVGVTFLLVLTFLFPLFLLTLLFNKKRTGLVLTRYWAGIFYLLIGMRIVIENKHFLDKKRTYIFCSNHFSYLDITTMTQLPVPFQFVGKHSLAKVPLFGYYFKKFHIMVDRDNLRSRYMAFKQSVEALKSGRSLTVFPEGGINVSNTKELSEFKEGPFRMALETGVSLVPITIADNWKILPDDGNFTINWMRRSRVIIHEPIDPSKYSIESMEEFQSDVRKVIQTELDLRNDS